ncbi:teichoic acids export ABC transporter ATP-binding subunit TagH [Peribacillus glennii]|uniref:Teichoic acids export ABC transporter ATP-binding subunit TagH n=1 Tax=Peribacillus glennii TaxID=2303991 RepID=A0A372LD92_9BACI|nr:teichoic acids export ABC transporter ATP-binding subunit TagH [Peribacillus glennii]
MSDTVIVKNVTKKFKLHRKASEKLLDIILPNGYGEDFYALQNITFTAKKGDVIGLVGVNGSGKSTLSNIISGIIPPTHGEVTTKGQISLIAIKSGLNNQLTGRENIELKLLMLGFNKKEIKELEPEIIDFADIGKFIDQPVKKYSSGMKSRLGFSISVTVDPDILIIDEALSVGDQAFADKSKEKMFSFRDSGKTIFFVSHAISQVKQFCTKVMWLEYGEIRAFDKTEIVVPEYKKFLKEYRAMSREERKEFRERAMEKQSRPLETVK